VLTDLTIRVLAQPFFAGMTIGLVRELCECAKADTYPAGVTMFPEGGPADAFWLLEEGTVALGLHVPGRGDQVIETIGPGTLLGWSWLYPPYRWQFGANTIEPVKAVRFDAAAVRLRCETDAEFGCAIMSRLTPVITERLQATRLRLLDLWSRP
jgi:CRP-like cAMP-binding protein